MVGLPKRLATSSRRRASASAMATWRAFRSGRRSRALWCHISGLIFAISGGSKLPVQVERAGGDAEGAVEVLPGIDESGAADAELSAGVGEFGADDDQVRRRQPAIVDQFLHLLHGLRIESYSILNEL